MGLVVSTDPAISILPYTHPELPSILLQVNNRTSAKWMCLDCIRYVVAIKSRLPISGITTGYPETVSYPHPVSY
jgi:hypothetical protein